METANVIGIDLAKNTFQVHGAKADGSVAYRKAEQGEASGVSRRPPALCGGDGCVRQRPLLGP